MTLTFAILALTTLAGAAAAMSLRNLVHCALAAAVSFVGLAGVFLELEAPFLGFAQILVYVGAVSVLVMFAILLTRSGGTESRPLAVSPLVGVALAGLVLGTLLLVMGGGEDGTRTAPAIPEVTTRMLGERLMTEYVLPLELIALLLTAALIGGVLLAMQPAAGKAGASGSTTPETASAGPEAEPSTPSPPSLS